MIIGIDAGASALKLAGMKSGELVFSHYEPRGRRKISELLPDGVTELVVTGVGTDSCGALELGLPVRRVSELEAIGCGGCFLAKRERAVVMSFGTGTAFVLAENGGYRHLGGSGVGGGTLAGLGEHFLGIHDVNALDELALKGDTYMVDLTVGDLFEGSETLDTRMTASNLAKHNPEATRADWAAGLVNLVLQAVGSMAVIACGGHGVKTVIVTGAASRVPLAPPVYAHFQRVYGIEFILPQNAELATAIGAVLIAEGGK